MEGQGVELEVASSRGVPSAVPGTGVPGAADAAARGTLYYAEYTSYDFLGTPSLVPYSAGSEEVDHG